MDEQNGQNPVPEKSVWDVFVAKLKFWTKESTSGEQASVPSEEAPISESQPPKNQSALSEAPKTEAPVEEAGDSASKLEKSPSEQAAGFPWFACLSLGTSLVAQLSLEPSPGRTPWPGLVLYILALAFLIVAVIRKEWQLPTLKPEAEEPLKITFRLEFLLVGVILAVLTYILFGNGMFQFLNTSLWVLAIIFLFLSFWRFTPGKRLDLKAVFAPLGQDGWKVRITRWTLIVLAILAVVLFYNFYRLDSVPPEMVSDQAEKLLDINDILHGHTPVYFPRNTGREVIHFYLTAAYMAIFNLEVSFLNLKAVAVFANLLTLLFIYFLGKEVGNKWVGLFSVFFAGIAYWPLLFTRLALRIPYYPLFVAPVMYFMVRGLRRQDMRDILWTGFFLGLGLHGYTPFRIVPIFVVVGFIIYILHRVGRKRLLQSVFALMVIVILSVVVFIPLMRYALDNPEMFSYRAFSRLTGMEAGFQEPAFVIFLKNFWRASVMFFWDNGVIWAHSVPGRPALDVVSGALYFLGIASLLIRYIMKRRWEDIYLLVSIPMLMMPSILSLAYPGENPCLNRTAGAVVPVFVIAALAFESLLRTIKQHLHGKLGQTLVVLLSLGLMIWSGVNNFNLVFDQYYTIYLNSSWNTSEIGEIARFFAESMGSPETVYVVGYPHWIDSRLVAINSGFTGRDYAIFPDQIPQTVSNPAAKLFFINLNDGENMQLLLETFPDGVLWQYDSRVENKDFMIFFVPPSQGDTP